MRNNDTETPNIYYFISVREFLKASFDSKKHKNPRFSLRAFSKHLGISSTSLSDYMNGKIILSFENYNRLSESLGLDQKTKEFFLLLAKYELLGNSNLRDQVLGEIEKKGRLFWPNTVESPEIVLKKLIPFKEYRYAIPGEMKFRVLIRFKEKTTGNISPHFVDRYFHSELEMASSAIFIKKENGLYCSFLKKGFDKESSFQFLSKENDDINIFFKEDIFPEIKNFTISVLNTDLLARSSILFDEERVCFKGEKFHPDNKNKIVGHINDLYLRV